MSSSTGDRIGGNSNAEKKRMNHSDISFLSLLIVLGLAFIVPILASRLKGLWIPLVIGEIIAGAAVGKSGFGIVEETTVLTILSELGFIYLMFLSGLEIDFSKVMRTGNRRDPQSAASWLQNPLALGVLTYGLTLGLSGLAAWGFKGAGWIQDPWLTALILSTTSLGIVVPVLKEKKLNRTSYGQLLLVSAIVADFGSIFLVSVYIMIRSQGLTAEILLILALLAAFAAVYRIAVFLQKHFPAERFLEELSTATSQIRLRGSLVLALIFVVLAERLGAETILGAFLAGVIVSMSSDDSSLLKKKLDAVGYGFFIPIFFVMVGVNFDIRSLLSSSSAMLLAPALIAAAFAVKLISSCLYRAVCSWRETFSAGVLMSSRLSLIIAVAAIGVQTGLIAEAVNAAVILTAVVTCTAAPVLFNVLAPEPAETPDGALIVGCRHLGETLFTRLGDRGLEARLICDDPASEEKPSGNDNGSPSRVRFHENLRKKLEQDVNSQKFATFVAVTDHDADGLRLCRMARKIFGVRNIVAWVNEPSNNPDFRKLGARIVNPSYSTLLVMENLVVNPEAFSMTPDLDEAMEIKDVKVKNASVIGKAVGDLALPPHVTVLSIRRGGETFMPENETALRSNDMITLAGPEDDVSEIVKSFI